VAYAVWPRHGLGRRVACATSNCRFRHRRRRLEDGQRFPAAQSSSSPTCVGAPHDGSNRLFVLERRGTIQVIRNDPTTTTKRQFLDIYGEVMRQPYEDDGALALILHPSSASPSLAESRVLLCVLHRQGPAPSASTACRDSMCRWSERRRTRRRSWCSYDQLGPRFLAQTAAAWPSVRTGFCTSASATKEERAGSVRQWPEDR